MPFRQLPSTIAGSQGAFDAAHDKWTNTPAAARLFSQDQFTRYLDLTKPPEDQPGSLYYRFQKEAGESAGALAVQTPLTGALDTTRGLLRLHLSHFIQNLNNAILRGALPRETRTVFQLPLGSDRVPDLLTDTDLLLWAQRIIDGEKQRAEAGGTPLAWPSAAEVAAVRDQFRTQSAAQSEAKDSTLREQADVERLMPDVLAAIKDLWDTIEFNLRHEETNSRRRRRAREWGLLYATRPGETADEEEPPAGGSPGGAPASPQG